MQEGLEKSGNKTLGLSGAQLKLLAMALMLIDHIGAYLLFTGPLYGFCRIIGRLAFPIFCFMIAEGATHTRSITKYAGRLLVFAIISTPPYNLVHGNVWYSLDELNVFFTLLFGLLGIASIKELSPRIFNALGKGKLAENKAACMWCGFPFCMVLYLSASALHTDYGGYGVAVVLILYIFREEQFKAWIGFAVLTILAYGIWFVGPANVFPLELYKMLCCIPWHGEYKMVFSLQTQLFAIAALFPISFYNGKKSSKQNNGGYTKYLFYAFYPAHLAILSIIQQIMGIN